MSSALSSRVSVWFPHTVRNVHKTFTSQANALASNLRETPTPNSFRCIECNPASHTVQQAGLFYTIPERESLIFHHGGLPRPYMQQCTTFHETSLMIRKPAIEVIECLKTANYKNPPMKYVLYGKPGVGKTLVMAHILHYASVSKWILVHVPWVGNWLRSPKEVVNSVKRPGFVDLPENAVKWLLHFKTQNSALIKELDLRLLHDYEWSLRETSKIGDPLLDIVELGLNRSRHASEIIIALLKEIKALCIADKCRVMVAVDGFNGFFYANTRVLNEEKVVMPPEKVSFIPAFIDTVAPDWHNAALVLTCDEIVVPGHNASPLPVYQLGIDGFHKLNPFLPINVPLLTEAEVRSILAYYKERRWLQATQGDDELVFLCGGNPYKLMNLCNPL